ARPVLTDRLAVDLSTQHNKGHFTSVGIEELRTKPIAIMMQRMAYILPKISETDTPCTDDTWTATNVNNAHEARAGHTAVWTGSEMVIWGGNDFSNRFGGTRYNPATDSWTSTSTTNAPENRSGHTAVWTGSEMIVWGGIHGSRPYTLNTGGRYNPSTDSWTATSITNVPNHRWYHTAVWTGGEMILLG